MRKPFLHPANAIIDLVEDHVIEQAASVNLTKIERRNVPVLMLGVAAILSLLVIFTDDGQELAPRYHIDDGLAVAISLALGALSFVAMIRIRPRGWKDVLLALGWSAGTAFVYCPVTGITLQRLHEMADFHGHEIVESLQDLPIRTAFISRYHGTKYYDVWLRDGTARLGVARDDYVAAFGDVERVWPKGYCIHATVQTAGTATRIVARHGMDLPAGSLGRCDAGGNKIVKPMSAAETESAWTKALATPAPAIPAAP